MPGIIRTIWSYGILWRVIPWHIRTSRRCRNDVLLGQLIGFVAGCCVCMCRCGQADGLHIWTGVPCYCLLQYAGRLSLPFVQGAECPARVHVAPAGTCY
jgi:hypothetical protein